MVADVLSGLDAIVWIANPQTLTVAHVSDSAEKLLGYDHRTWVSDSSIWERVLRTDEREKTLAMWRAVASDGTERRVVHRVIASGGDERWFSTRVRAIRGSDESIHRLVGVMVDVSEPVFAERELRERESLRRLVLDQLPTIAYTTDRQLRFTTGAGAGLARLGVLPDQLLGVGVEEYLQTDDPEHPIVEYHRRALAGETLTFDTERLGFTYHTYLQPFRDASGTIIGTLGVALDVTDARRAEASRAESDAQFRKQLEQNAAELRAVLDNITDVVVACNAEGRITFWNHAASTLFEWDGASTPRMLADVPDRLRLHHRDGRPAALRDLPLARALAGEPSPRGSFVVSREPVGRDLDVQSSAGAIRDRSGAIVGAVSVASDVTDAMAFERQRARFASVAAHELKTPLAIMKGHAQRATRYRDRLPEVVRSAIDAIQRGADRIDRVVQTLLDVSQLDLGTLVIAPASVDIAQLTADAVRQAARRAPKHRIRIVRSEPATVRVDVYRLGNVLLNVLDNAVRFSPHGGDVDVSVSAEREHAVIAVRDYGVGIAPDQQARIFERYYRANSGAAADYGGLGVGLYTSREIVARHGGSISFESPGPSGTGTVFFIRLPLEGTHGEH